MNCKQTSHSIYNVYINTYVVFNKVKKYIYCCLPCNHDCKSYVNVCCYFLLEYLFTFLHRPIHTM